MCVPPWSKGWWRKEKEMKCPDDSKIPTKTTVKSNLEYIYGKNRYFLHKITKLQGSKAV